MPMNAETRAGLFAAIAAYGLWGFLPLYFQFLGDMPPLVILAHRIVWSVPTALILVIAAGKWGEFAGVFRAPRMLFTLLASSIAIAANWTIYIWAVTNHRVLEGSLGYYINPLIVFLFAAMFFGERFRPLQLLAVGIAAAGVLNQTLVVGQFPFLANGRALSMDEGDDGGFVRVTARASDHRILGIQAVGVHISEFAGEFGTLIEMGAVLEDVAGIIHAHPTLGEAIHESALAALGHAIHV